MESVDRAWRRGGSKVTGRAPAASRVRGAHLQVDDGVGAVALHGVELQVALEVLGVEAGDGEAVAKASLRGGGKRISPAPRNDQLHLGLGQLLLTSGVRVCSPICGVGAVEYM